MAEFRIIIKDQIAVNAADTKVTVKVEIEPLPKSIDDYTPAQLYGLRLLEMIDMDGKKTTPKTHEAETPETKTQSDKVE